MGLVDEEGMTKFESTISQEEISCVAPSDQTENKVTDTAVYTSTTGHPQALHPMEDKEKPVPQETPEEGFSSSLPAEITEKDLSPSVPLIIPEKCLGSEPLKSQVSTYPSPPAMNEENLGSSEPQENPEEGLIAPLEPPSGKDAGYAWLVLFLVFMVNLVTAGNFKSFGITYTIILDYFPDASGAGAGWILGLLMGCRCLLSPVMGALTVIIGPRKCIVFGGLICAGSFLLAVPALSIEYMAFTLGALFGAGMCMAETPGYIVVTDYFERRRPFANGVRAAGNPMGGVIFSPLVVLLHRHFGFQGALVMMAGVMLQLAVLGMLMRPFEQHQRIVTEDFWRKRVQSNPSWYQRKQDQENMQTQKKNNNKKKPLQFSFFRNPSYLVYLAVVICSTAALPNALFFLPVYGRTIGLTDMQNSFVSSYCSLSDSLMRLACGSIFSCKVFKKTNGFIVSLLVGAAGCLIVPLCGSMWQLLISATMFSLCMGFFWTLINILLAEQFGGDAMPSTWGFFRMVQGICSFVYPPLIGFVMDSTGGMAAPYALMGILTFGAAVIFALQPLIAKLPGSKINLT
ncbi:monocarboxylate transporter 2-like isoform X2 [Macrobrachium nipponense]|uniref:monocarboxylate transporter 2-like isoform X2 n=1 Tax=Macrobrachium nipponense TaxID=159736 RepID=UPI0030C7DDBA